MVAEVLERIPVNCGRRIYYVVKVEGRSQNVSLKKEGNEFFYLLNYPDMTVQEKFELIAFIRQYEWEFRHPKDQNNT